MVNVSEVTKGAIFYDSSVNDEESSDFGILEVASCIIEDGRRAVLCQDFIKYEKAKEIHIMFKNEKGCVGGKLYWLDEFEKRNPLVLLDCENKEKAKHDFEQQFILSKFKSAINRLCYKLEDKENHKESILNVMQEAVRVAGDENVKELSTRILDLYRDMMLFE